MCVYIYICIDIYICIYMYVYMYNLYIYIYVGTLWQIKIGFQYYHVEEVNQRSKLSLFLVAMSVCWVFFCDLSWRYLSSLLTFAIPFTCLLMSWKM